MIFVGELWLTIIIRCLVPIMKYISVDSTLIFWYHCIYLRCRLNRSRLVQWNRYSLSSDKTRLILWVRMRSEVRPNQIVFFSNVGHTCISVLFCFWNVLFYRCYIHNMWLCYYLVVWYRYIHINMCVVWSITFDCSSLWKGHGLHWDDSAFGERGQIHQGGQRWNGWVNGLTQGEGGLGRRLLVVLGWFCWLFLVGSLISWLFLVGWLFVVALGWLVSWLFVGVVLF